jgi:hypothetical protein
MQLGNNYRGYVGVETLWSYDDYMRRTSLMGMAASLKILCRSATTNSNLLAAFRLLPLVFSSYVHGSTIDLYTLRYAAGDEAGMGVCRVYS